MRVRALGHGVDAGVELIASDAVLSTAELTGELRTWYVPLAREAASVLDYLMPPLPNTVCTRDTTCWLYDGVSQLARAALVPSDEPRAHVAPECAATPLRPH